MLYDVGLCGVSPLENLRRMPRPKYDTPISGASGRRGALDECNPELVVQHHLAYN